MPKLKDISGQKFQMLTAIRRVENKPGYGQAVWLFECDCGNQVTAFGYNVVHGKQKSCGCYKATSQHPMQKHGMAGEPEFTTWTAIRQRCTNPSNKAYLHYGGRGIEVCKRWDTFEAFFEDMGYRPPGMTLDRIDNNGPYSPENCRWATKTTQVRNRRVTVMVDYFGEQISLADLAERLGQPYKRLHNRYVVQGKRGHDLSAPPRSIYPNKRKRDSRI